MEVCTLGQNGLQVSPSFPAAKGKREFHPKEPPSQGFLKPAVANLLDLMDHQWAADHRLATAGLEDD